MSSLTELETELAALKAARPSGGISEIRHGDRSLRRDIAAQDARIKELESQVRRARIAESRAPIGLRF